MDTTFDEAVEMAAENLRRGAPFGIAVGEACAYFDFHSKEDFRDIAHALSERSADARGARKAKRENAPSLASIMAKINAQPER